MSNDKSSNLHISIQSRLLNLSRQHGSDFNLLLRQYANERLLYRIDQSDFRDSLILKGAMLFFLWTGQLHRPTRDLDLLGFGNSSPERLLQMFRQLAELDVEPDGLIFDIDSIAVNDIRAEQEYAGHRVRLLVLLGKTRIHVQVDIGFGDIIVPEPIWLSFPTLLDLPAPHLRTYPRETVIAEKLHAMVDLGMGNSRMKDFYDLQVLSQQFEFDAGNLANAIESTFQRRGTMLPDGSPLALTSTFAENRDKQTQWNAFLRRDQLEAAELADVITDLRLFLLPVIELLKMEAPTVLWWPAGGPWQVE